ncbi:MAG TPA: hypothetical protein VK919_12640 [Solirubrobacterales bacterium]|nr:hypothetical protein [Solirubrobacterales bacterium]
MKIIIKTDEEEKPAARRERAEEPEAAAPPEELAARAEALGAASAGQAPAETRAEGPPPFVEEPGAPETAPPTHAVEGAMSAGAAPSLAIGEPEVEEVEAGESADAEDAEAGTPEES